MAKKIKSIDRGLIKLAIAVTVIANLLTKQNIIVIGWLIVVFILLFEPIWNFYWIEKTLRRRIVTLIIFAGVLVIIGFFSWPKLPDLKLYYHDSEITQHQNIAVMVDTGYVDLRLFTLKNMGKAETQGVDVRTCFGEGIDSVGMLLNPNPKEKQYPWCYPNQIPGFLRPGDDRIFIYSIQPKKVPSNIKIKVYANYSGAGPLTKEFTIDVKAP